MSIIEGLDAVKSFLPQIKKSNAELELIPDSERNIEITDGSYYIDMDLALGILEDKEAKIEYKEAIDEAGVTFDALLNDMIQTAAPSKISEILGSKRVKKTGLSVCILR